MGVALPTIPQYFKEHVDRDIDLATTPSIPCPFHNETHGKSFSYSLQLGVWRCFGQCHCGGDVIDLHRLHFHLKSRREAEKSLCAMYGVTLSNIEFKKKKVEVDEDDIHRRRVYNRALQLAKVPDDWVELDYILSKVPYDVKELEVFCSERGFVV